MAEVHANTDPPLETDAPAKNAFDDGIGFVQYKGYKYMKKAPFDNPTKGFKSVLDIKPDLSSWVWSNGERMACGFDDMSPQHVFGPRPDAPPPLLQFIVKEFFAHVFEMTLASMNLAFWLCSEAFFPPPSYVCPDQRGTWKHYMWGRLVHLFLYFPFILQAITTMNWEKFVFWRVKLAVRITIEWTVLFAILTVAMQYVVQIPSVRGNFGILFDCIFINVFC